jgi:hypothetical protein
MDKIVDDEDFDEDNYDEATGDYKESVRRVVVLA